MSQSRKTVFLLVAITALIAILITPSLSSPKTTTVLPNITPTHLLSAQSTALPPITHFESRIAWFYKPVKNEELSQLVDRYAFFILTRNDETERDQLIAMGAPKPILQYFRFDAIEDPGSCTAQPFRNQVAYFPGDFCMISEDHPDWFLLDQYGQKIWENESGKDYFHMDPGNPGWRDFFLGRVKENMADVNWDGVFLDNLEISLARLESRGRIPRRYPNDQSYRAAIQSFLQYMREEYFTEQGKFIFANLIAQHNESDRLDNLEFLDGIMHESWSVSKSKGYYPIKTWESQMLLAEQTQQAGKFIILVSQGDKDDLRKERFTFASYLLVAQGSAAFRYANSDRYNEIWWYDNYALDLGQPLGPRYKQGELWYRDFTNGRVIVNPKTHEAEIFVTK